MDINIKLLAFALGDGCISRDGQFLCAHSIKQREYAIWKYNYMSNLISMGKYPKCFDNNGYPGIKFNSKRSEELKKIRKILYTNGVKTFSDEVVNNMNAFSLAVLYCDDGSLIAKKRNGKIHAYDLIISIYGTEFECINLIKFIQETYGISFTLKRNKGKYSIRCGTRNAIKFLNLIKKEIPYFECFEKKFRLVL